MHLFVQCDIILSGFVGKYKITKIKMKKHSFKAFLSLAVAVAIGVFSFGASEVSGLTPDGPPEDDTDPTFKALTILEKLGIGDYSPISYDLHVNKFSERFSSITIDNVYLLTIYLGFQEYNFWGGGSLLFLSDGETKGELSLETPPSRTEASPQNRINLYSANLLRFLTGEGNNRAERLRITSDGKVGIGTTSPNAKLHVAGDAKVGESLSSTTLRLWSSKQMPPCNAANSGLVVHRSNPPLLGLHSCLCVETDGVDSCTRYSWSKIF